MCECVGVCVCVCVYVCVISRLIITVWIDLASKILHDLDRIILPDFGMASFRVITITLRIGIKLTNGCTFCPRETPGS